MTIVKICLMLKYCVKPVPKMMVIASLLKTFYNRIRKPHPAVLFFREQVVFDTNRSENPTCSRPSEASSTESPQTDRRCLR